MINAEKILFTRVQDCPNQGNGKCAFMHTCVEYDEKGNVVKRVNQ
jgi:hypothetical protein